MVNYSFKLFQAGATSRIDFYLELTDYIGYLFIY